MIITIKITLFPTMVQRRELGRLQIMGRRLCGELLQQLEQTAGNEVREMVLPREYWNCSQGIVESAWKEARKIAAQSQAGHEKRVRPVVACLWKKSEFTLCNNQLTLKGMTSSPIYYIAPVYQRRLLNQGVPLKLSVRHTDQQWEAVLCLLCPDQKKDGSQQRNPSQSIPYRSTEA